MAGSGPAGAGKTCSGVWLAKPAPRRGWKQRVVPGRAQVMAWQRHTSEWRAVPEARPAEPNTVDNATAGMVSAPAPGCLKPTLYI